MKKKTKVRGKREAMDFPGILKHISTFLFSMPFALGAGLVFAIAIAAATFIETKQGTDLARAMVYNALWFEILLAWIGVNLTANLIRHQLWRGGKRTVFLFHAAFLLILLGAAVTRHWGLAGNLRIREGSQSDTLLSEKAYFSGTLKFAGQRIEFEKPISESASSINRFDRIWDLKSRSVRIRLMEIIPNAEKGIGASASVKPSCSLVLIDGGEREKRILFESESAEWKGLNFIFSSGNASSPSGAEVIISTRGMSLSFSSGRPVDVFSMTDRTRKTYPAGATIPLSSHVVYTVGAVRFVLEEFIPQTRNETVRPEKQMNQDETGADLKTALVVEATVNGQTETVSIFGAPGEPGIEENLNLGGVDISLVFGSKTVRLPFTLALNDFRIDRYPGSMKPSGYTSEVTIIDRENALEKPYSIYMNHILRYRGYRFYQSSYDPDEKGTILSVSRDPGALPTYTGFLLFTVGLVMTFFRPNSRFRLLGKTLRKTSGSALMALLTAGMLWTAVEAKASETTGRIHNLDMTSSRLFGLLTVQDAQGRIKPVNTLAKEVIWSENRLTSLSDLDPDRLALWMFAFPEETIPSGYFQNNAPENLFRLFPVKNDPSRRWVTDGEANTRLEGADREFAMRWTGSFRTFVRSGDWAQADSLLGALDSFQTSRARDLYPGKFHLKMEVFYNRLDVFARLAPALLWIGLALAACVTNRIWRPKWNLTRLCACFVLLISAAFLIQTAALGFRGIVSGHAPWTNKYESMIFISWAIMLAGMIFGFRHRLTLAAAAILSGILLSVAGMASVDPKIATLPPVLKSVWLIIHVSVITSSYGFLSLGALLALFNLLFMIARTKRTARFINSTIEHQTASIERILLVGLTLLTVGNFLGAVWANESWGRYWGWDPKETWTLVTILVYAVVVHMRLVPKLNGMAVFNIAALFAIGTVMMTYIGVNLYLKGMHSYASGGRAGFPVGIFAVAGVLVVLSVIAWRKEKT